MSDTAFKILIAIPTHRRPGGLDNALRSIAALTAPAAASIEVLVVENDRQKTVQPIIDAFERFAIHYVLEDKPGLVHVRNRILHEAARLNADYLAGMDDDETASPQWLAALWDGLNRFGATVAAGPTLSRFETEPPLWIRRGNFFKTEVERPTGRTLKRAAAGNFMLDLRFQNKHPVQYDMRFNFIGGEDSDFFSRIAAQGGKIVWIQEAVTYETVPAERMTLRYVLKRDFRIGLGRAAKARKKSLLFGILSGVFGLLIAHLYAITLPFHWTRASFAKRLCKLVKQLGVFIGLFRMDFKAYGAGSQ